MANATYEVPHFLGGEISQFAQGRFDRSDYRNSLNVCLNSFPVEIGPWTRRPGTAFASTTRGGAPGRVMKFDFQQSAPITMEFTDGYVRFRNGSSLIATNDTTTISAISNANPAVVTVNGAQNWPTGATVIITANCTDPLLQRRELIITAVDASNFSIADAVTGNSINGASLNGGGVGATIKRVHELTTPYVGGSWANIRPVQAETTDILLSGTTPPQATTVDNEPGMSPVFSIGAATFNDGPYLDPFTNGALATPSGKSGVVTLTISFQAYDSTKAYAIGSFVTSSGVNYISLIDQNVGNTPVSSPSAWATTSASSAINDGKGFLGTDVGRLVRLFSEPAAYSSATAYGVGSIVAYNPSGTPGASTYWQSLTSNTGKPPGSDLTNWQLIPSGAALWSWGKITALSNIIDRALAGSTSIGNMTGNGGLNAAFNGSFSQSKAASAVFETAPTGVFYVGSFITVTSFVGKNYSGATAQAIQSATVYPSSNFGFTNAGVFGPSGIGIELIGITFNLRGKATAPTSSSDGTLLGTAGAEVNTAATIRSSDKTTTWNYVWVEQVTVVEITGTLGTAASGYIVDNTIAQLSFFSPTGTGTSSGVSVEILGPALLYTNSMQTWRLGVYSGTTGWPTCGVYHDGRLYLGGAVPNRFDASYANGISGGTINFAPTDQFGVVSAANAISYTFNSDGANPILWMDPDLQGVKMGTQAGEWLVQAPTAGPISPLNISARNVTKHGSANVQPCRTEHTTIFVKRFARKLLEYFPDVFSGKFSAPNLADRAEHRTVAGIVELAYTSSVTPILWVRDALGALCGVTYKRDSLASAQPPTFYAWHQHALGSGRVVESICAGPSTGGDLDALTMVTNDPTTNVRHVEVLTDVPDETTSLASAWFLDDAVTAASTSILPVSQTYPLGAVRISGLWHLNGKTVQAFAGGLDLGDVGDEGTNYTDYVVSNGSITVPFGDGISAGPGAGLFTATFMLTSPQIVVGFTYNSDGQIVRRNEAAETGARNGPALGKLRRSHRYAMILSNAKGLSVGTDFGDTFPARFKQVDDNTAIGTLDAFSGIHQDSLQDNFSYDSMFCWRVSRPFPTTVVALAINTAAQDQ